MGKYSTSDLKDPLKKLVQRNQQTKNNSDKLAAEAVAAVLSAAPKVSKSDIEAMREQVEKATAELKKNIELYNKALPELKKAAEKAVGKIKDANGQYNAKNPEPKPAIFGTMLPMLAAISGLEPEK